MSRLLCLTRLQAQWWAKEDSNLRSPRPRRGIVDQTGLFALGVSPRGFEPLAVCLKGGRSTYLGYGPLEPEAGFEPAMRLRADGFKPSALTRLDYSGEW